MAAAPPVDEPQWPPRSPHEALLSTPGGRERYRRMNNRTSPSPSPLKKSRTVGLGASRSDGATAGGDDATGDEEDDEETLELKLQEIQARLKLKKLQSARARKTEAGPASRLEDSPSIPKRTGAEHRSASQRPIEVPASPVRKARPDPPQTSPRVLLGIDGTTRAISLKRAPSVRMNPDYGNNQPPHQPQQQSFGGYLKRSQTPSSNGASAQRAPEAIRPMSFNERLSAARTEESGRNDKLARIRQVRTTAFGIGQKEIEDLKSKAVDLPPPPPDEAPQFSREEIMGDAAPGASKRKEKRKAPEDVPETEATSFEPYSSYHLKRRIVPHSMLTRHLSGKKIMTIKELCQQVKAPEYELPDIEQDIVLFAIVAKRSEPRAHQPRPDRNGVQQADRGKYMVITVVDLELELELFLFNSGFTRFWKIGEGTVMAILNPTIMPPPQGRAGAGRFSVVINSDEDTIIEVGIARDLGSCKSIKKDGNPCGSWVNIKRTQFCEFHTNEAISRARHNRMEVNKAEFGTKDRSGYRLPSHDVVWKDGRDKPDKAAKVGSYDRSTHSHWFASKSMTPAELIDGANRFADKQERKEGLKRRLVAQEKERDIVDRLTKIGSGAGRDYMVQTGRQRDEARARAISASGSSASLTSTASDAPVKLDVKSLGLLAPKGRDAVHLGPVKRKRPDSSQSISTAGGSTATISTARGAAFGWGGNLKDKLGRMKEGEKFQPESDRQPVRKKTRFVTEKGIREAGRESLGDALPVDAGRRMVTLDDDDDDELVILQ
ncbi:DNA replication licensing factor mcm10 like protein [Verticillium longisporum]|nr:DNA replication licensing factor mcm10 like protein [Verticillium longisporum]